MLQFTPIGRVLKPKGIRGDLKVDLEDHFLEVMDTGMFLFIYYDGNYVPYRIEKLEVDNPAVLHLDGINNPEDASDLSGCNIFLAEREMALLKNVPIITTSTSEELVGYTMIDQDSNSIGRIVSIEQFPQQILAKVDTGKSKSLIPMNDSFVVSIDRDSLSIVMSLPEGLLDL